ncbi:hypothetical protein D3C76_1166330 [compost metagenome]
MAVLDFAAEPRFQFQPLLQRQFQAIPHRLADRLLRQQAVAAVGGRQFAGGGQRFAGLLHQFVGQADFQGAPAVHRFAAEHQAQRLLLADQARQQLRAAIHRHHPDPDFRQPQPGLRGGDAEGAAHGDLQPAAEGEAVDRRHADLREAAQAQDQLVHAADARVGVAGSALQVGAGAEGAPFAGDHQRPRVVAGDALEMGFQLVEQGIVDGVEGFRTVQGQHGADAVSLVGDALVHEGLPFLVRRW